jgi:predicted nucleotidyltransferase
VPVAAGQYNRADMIPELQDKAAQVAELCRRFRVRRLEVFGSAVNGKFDPTRSDIDFLVQYQELKFGEAYDAYFGLLEALEALFGRRIDLVMIDAVENPYFIQAINRTRTLLYAA